MKARFDYKAYAIEEAKEKGFEVIEYVDLKVVAIKGTTFSGKPSLKIFSGKRSKPDYNYYYASEERREESLKGYLENKRREIEYKVERAEKRKAENKKAREGIKVDDIYYSSWGYEQTNVDFYKVVAIEKGTAIFQEIGRSTVSGSEGYMSCSVIANPDIIAGSPFKKRISSYMSISSYQGLNPWDGKPKYCSWYA